jgi:hypothetical protein
LQSDIREDASSLEIPRSSSFLQKWIVEKPKTHVVATPDGFHAICIDNGKGKLFCLNCDVDASQKNVNNPVRRKLRSEKERGDRPYLRVK